MTQDGMSLLSVTSSQILMNAGFLVYSMSYCTIVETTTCEISLSTGQPVAPEVSTAVSSNAAGEATGTNYPAPSHGGDHSHPGSPEHSGSPGQSGYPSGGEGTSPGGGAVPTASATEGTAIESPSGTVSVSPGASENPTATEGESSYPGMPTGSAPSGTATAAAAMVNAFYAGVAGVAGLAAAYVF